MEIVEFLWSVTRGLDGFVIALFICELIFSLPAKLRRHARITIPVSLVIYFAAGWVVRYIPWFGRFTPSVYCLIVFAVSIALQQLCFNQSFKITLFNSSAAYILQNLALNVKEAATAAIDDRVWKLVTQIVIEIAVFVAYYFLLARRNKFKKAEITNFHIVVIALFSVLVSNIFFTVIAASRFNMWQTVAVKCILAICCNLALFFQFMIFRNAALNNEKAIVEQLLVNEQKQHKMSQENIDLINIKCHDLKKQIGLLRKCSESGDMSGLISDVQNAVSVYDESVDTGNSNLDLVLTEKQLYCMKNKIRVELMADGEKLNFMSAADIYSLFGNALDNAIESVLELDESERVINMDIRQKNDFVSVAVSNPCKKNVSFERGIPLTSKADEKYHGYGTRSMKYIVEKYGGNIVFREKNDTFSVYIMFPLRVK